MVRPFRFGVQLLSLDDRATLVAAAQQAEALGYDELFSHDHVGSVDPFIPLMVAAAATTRLRVGPLVLNNELHHPALLARTAATVDRLTGGRLVLGLGTGYMEAEHEAIGMPLREPGARVSRFEESVRALRSLLEHGAVALEGAHHTLAVDDLGVHPLQERVPLLIGGHGRRVVTVAARHADIFQFTGLTHGEGGVPRPAGFELAIVAERNRWLIEAAGERLAAIERSTLVQRVAIGPDAGDDIAGVAERYGFDRATIEATPFLLMGSVEQVIDKLERLREELGVTHVVVRDAEGFAPVVAALAGR